MVEAYETAKANLETELRIANAMLIAADLLCEDNKDLEPDLVYYYAVNLKNAEEKVEEIQYQLDMLELERKFG